MSGYGVKWIKISVDFLDGASFKFFRRAKLRRIQNPRDKLESVWFELLALAGKSNDGGYLEAGGKPVASAREIATLLDREEAEVGPCLAFFERDGMLRRDQKGLLVANFERYQNAAALDRIREQGRARAAAGRARSKGGGQPPESGAAETGGGTAKGADDPGEPKTFSEESSNVKADGASSFAPPSVTRPLHDRYTSVTRALLSLENKNKNEKENDAKNKTADAKDTYTENPENETTETTTDKRNEDATDEMPDAYLGLRKSSKDNVGGEREGRLAEWVFELAEAGFLLGSAPKGPFLRQLDVWDGVYGPEAVGCAVRAFAAQGPWTGIRDPFAFFSARVGGMLSRGEGRPREPDPPKAASDDQPMSDEEYERILDGYAKKGATGA